MDLAKAKVNNSPSGYMAGATVMAIGTVGGGPIPELASFYVDGDPVQHIVTDTDGTTSITFTPALTENIAHDADITFGGRTVEVKLGEGNLTYTEARTIEYVLDRGTLDLVREGDDVPVEVSLDAVWEFLTAVAASGTPTVSDAMKFRGEAADWISTSDDPCEPKCVDLELEYVPPCVEQDIPPEVITLPEFRWNSIAHDLRAGTLAFSGSCNVKEAIVVRPE